MMDETRFDDGNTSIVVRVGSTVRRATGAWTPAVHALLRHLEEVGFDGAPRVLGMDEQGREVLTYIEGQTMPASLEGARSDDVLIQVARLLRRYHDATTSFQPPAAAQWRFTIGAPTEGNVICHNDVGPWNVVTRDGQAVALIDWDFAAPAPRAWDIAYSLWRFAPLYPDAQFGSPGERGRRMRLFCDTYGLSQREGLLDLVERRMQVLYATLAAWAAAGEPAFVKMWKEGHGLGILKDMAYVRTYRDELEQALTPG